MSLPKPVLLRNLLVLTFLLSFTAIFAQPVINSFAPATGAVGTKLIIKGSNFNTTPGLDIVYFGAVKAKVLTATSTALTVEVPAGASCQQLTVTTGGLTAWSSLPFTPTFGAGGVAFSTASFAAAITLAASDNILRAGDLDGDGLPDIVTSLGGWYSPTVKRYFSVLKNNSTPSGISFAPTQNVSLRGNSSFYNSFYNTLADMDGDGLQDVLTTDSVAAGWGVGIFRNTSSSGAVSFAPEVGLFTNVFGWPPRAMIARDFDGDGKTDLITANDENNYNAGFYPDSLNIFLNTGTVGSITLKKTSAIAIGQAIQGAVDGPNDLLSFDMNLDGKPDLIVMGDLGILYMLQNTSTPGHISFELVGEFSASRSSHVTIADLDGDGRPDLSYVGADKIVYVRRNVSSKGNAVFDGPRSLTDVATGDSPDYITAGDLDGDGKPDLVTGSNNTNTLSLYRNSSSNGEITFDNAVNLGYNNNTNGITNVVIQDIDGDGRPELVGTRTNDETVSVLRNLMAAIGKPVITSFSPASASAGDTVTFTGTNLTGTNNLSFGGTAPRSFTVISATGLTAILDTGATGNIILNAPGGADTASGFQYIKPSKPVVLAFTPQALPYQQVYVNGRHLLTTTAVTFGGVPCYSFSVLNDTSLSATVGAGASGYVAVTTTAGKDSLAGFTLLNPALVPAIYYYYPQSATTGDTVTIRGIVPNVTQVSFGGVSATSFRILDDSTLKAVVGAGASGSIVIATSQSPASASGFTFIPGTAKPVLLSSFIPASGRTNDTIFIKGQNLKGTSAVRFGKVAASSFYVFSDSVVAAVVGTGATGQVWIAGIKGQDSLPGFTYIGAPQDSVPVVTPPNDSIPPTPPQDSVPVITPPQDSLPSAAHDFQLLHFAGVDTAGATILTWQTLYDEKIVYYFVRSGIDSAHLTVISTVPSRRSDQAGYSYNVVPAPPGKVYYQLQMEDTAARYTYGPVIAVTGPPVVQTIISYPNPTSNTLTVDVPVSTNSSWFVLTDQSGKVMRTIKVSANTTQVTIDVSGLIKGIYKLGWSDGHRKSATTILVVK